MLVKWVRTAYVCGGWFGIKHKLLLGSGGGVYQEFTQVECQWKGSNCKQSARWQHVSQLKANAFCIW
jgi:hypothetical protein